MAGAARAGREGAVDPNIGRNTLRRLVTGAAAAALAALLVPVSASAFVAHTVQPGETLWSIAAASNFTTRALAAANGLPETANVVAGQTIWVPSVGEAAAALRGGPVVGT